MRLAAVTLALLTTAALGCAAPAQSRSPAAPAAPPRAAAAGPAGSVPAGADVSVRISSSGASSTLAVQITHDHAAPLAWLAPRGAPRLAELRARDRRGALAVSHDPAEGRIVIDGARAVEPPLELSYQLSTFEVQGGCPLELTPDRAVFCGEQVLARPEAAARGTLRLELVPDPVYHHAAASSFGLEPTLVTRATLDDAARAAFVFGDLGRASFEAPEGRDHAAWVGYFSFDPRWVAAEAAGVRTFADRWLGVARPADDPSAAFMLLPASPGTRGLQVRPALRGATIEADVGAAWTARGRVELTRLLLKRTIGAAVTVRVDDLPDAASLFFDEGFAHAGALDVLSTSGVITPEERLAEVNALLAEEALSPHAGAPLAALARAAGGSGPAPDRAAAARLLAVRGALVGVAWGEPPGALSSLAKAAVSAAADARQPALPLAELRALARAKVGDARADDSLDALLDGRRIPLPSSSLGPCAKLKDTTFYPYELGYVARSEADGLRVESVRPGSAAEAAGLRPGDLASSVELVPDNAYVPVRMKLQSGKALEFLPRGPGKKGKAFVAVSSAACRVP